jgi:hypothetical protein
MPRNRKGYAARKTDTNIQQTIDRVHAMFERAQARVDAKLKAEVEAEASLQAEAAKLREAKDHQE